MFRRLLPVLKTVVPALSCGLAAEKSLAKCEDGVPAVFPTRLQNQAGKLVDSREALAGKHVLLYFSAKWCPPCRQFTPVLKEFIARANRKGEKVVVVFVPSDETAKDAQAYFAEDHGDWFMVPFDDSSRWDLKKRYGCWAGKAERAVLGDGSQPSDAEKRFGIPTLLLVNADRDDGAELDFTVRAKVAEAIADDEKTGRKAPLFRVDAAVNSFASCKKLAANI